jgi:hypothetical protein
MRNGDKTIAVNHVVTAEFYAPSGEIPSHHLAFN